MDVKNLNQKESVNDAVIEEINYFVLWVVGNLVDEISPIRNHFLSFVKEEGGRKDVIADHPSMRSQLI